MLVVVIDVPLSRCERRQEHIRHHMQQHIQRRVVQRPILDDRTDVGDRGHRCLSLDEVLDLRALLIAAFNAGALSDDRWHGRDHQGVDACIVVDQQACGVRVQQKVADELIVLRKVILVIFGARMLTTIIHRHPLLHPGDQRLWRNSRLPRSQRRSAWRCQLRVRSQWLDWQVRCLYATYVRVVRVGRVGKDGRHGGSGSCRCV